MALLTSVFQKLLSMALTALPVTAVVLLARFFLRKAPKKFSCVLWLAVAFRLVCPVAPEGAVGIVRGPETARWVEDAAETYMEPTLTYRDNGGFTPDYEVLLNRGYTPNARGEIVTNEAGTREAYQVADLMGAAALVWLAGMAAMLGWMALSYLRLRRLVAAAVRRERDVWECDAIGSPFVMGLFRPRIYLPFHLDDNQRTYVMAHERYHIRRKDPWWKLLGCLILAVYWWDIAVWLCWALFCRDLEMSCDEAVLDRLGDQAKAGYSLSLVDFAQARRFPTALAFGEHDAARRVKNVLRWKRARPAAACAAMAAVLLVVSVCVHDAEPDGESRVTLGTGENGGAEFTVRAAENVRSWAICEDLYEEGRLISSTCRVLDGFRDQGDGASPREFEGSLGAEAAYSADSGFEGTLAMHYEAVGGGTFDLALPKDGYTGMVMMVGDSSQTQFHMKPGEEVTLYTVLLSTEPDGAVAMSGDLTRANDTVVRYRLVLSGDSYTELEDPPLDLAQTLYDLRTDSAADTAGVQKLLDTLGTGDLGTYEASASGGERETVLGVAFDSSLDEEQENRMWTITQVLLALVGDLDRVDYAFPTENGSSLMTVYCDGTPVGSWAESMGYGSVKDLARSARGVRELLNYLGWDQTEIEPYNRVTGEIPTGEVPYLAHGGCVAQYAYDLAEDVKTAGLWAVLYQNGVPVSEGPLWQASPGTEEFPRQGRFWLRYGVSDAAGGWDRMRLEVGPWSGEAGQVWKPWDSVSFQLRRGYGAGGREERALEGTTALTGSGAAPIFAAYISDGALAAVPAEELGDINTLQETVRDNDVVLVVWLSLSPEEDTLTRPATGLESEVFTDILGYDGYLVTASWPLSAYWSTRTYYAADRDTGDLTPIAESFGWGEARDYPVDLDGDGMEELVCNVQYGGDGAVQVCVYQRRADGVYLGYLDTEDLPGHFDWGINSVWEEYDPAENVFRIHYAVEGQEDYAVLETRGLERVVFEKYEP